MKLPQGRLQRRRVVTDLSTPLARALEDELTGYVRLHSQDALLLGSDGVGILTFDCGVPTVAYHTGADCGGTDALTEIAVAGPYRIERFELDSDALAAVHESTELAVDPGAPAEQLAGDPDLARHTRERAPEDRLDDDSNDQNPVTAFLDDEDRIQEIQRAAREEAHSRATEWGLPPE